MSVSTPIFTTSSEMPSASAAAGANPARQPAKKPARFDQRLPWRTSLDCI